MRPASTTMRRFRVPTPEALRRLRLLALDVDGTLTDGAMYYGPDGEVLKRFHTRDGHGLSLVRRAGLEVAIVTSEDSPIAAARARKLGITRVFLGITDKRETLDKLMAELGVEPSETAYMGDDLNDLDCLKRVGVSACPSDAVEEIRRAAGYVCRVAGGHGAVREFCDKILAAKAAGKEA